MKATIAFIFFMLFLAGIAFVNLRGMQEIREERPASTDDLVQIAWRPIRLGEMKLAEDTEMLLQFGDTGEVHGNAGCNRFSGSYDVASGTLQLGPLAATRKACPEPAASFEISFLDALQSTTNAAFSGNVLILRNGQGDIVVRLVSSERQ